MKQDKNNWPTVSFAIATFNSSRTLEACLSSIRNQDYPRSIEIVIADGSSVDNTLEIAQKFGSKIIKVPKHKQNAEYNKGVAVNSTTKEILVMIDHDNILPHSQWLKNMILPLKEDPDIFGSAVLRFHYDRKMSLLDRYFSLIGGTDPVPVFFNKSAHQSWTHENFHLRGQVLEEKFKYYIVKLNPNFLPALGGNGSALRKGLLRKAKANPNNFFHIDIHVDLSRKGFVKYAFVKETIIHLTSNKLWPFLLRRKQFIEKYHFVDRSKRRYSIYQPEQDRWRLIRYIFYSLSLIGPILYAIRGYKKVKDPAWFLHPLMCFSMLFFYGYPTIREEAKRVIFKR